MIKIGVYSESSGLSVIAMQLAKQLQLPYVTDADISQFDYLVICTAKFIGLQSTAKQTMLPFYIDFLSAPMTYRRKAATTRKETLARALGLKLTLPVTIFDLTAGLGRDSFILASLGFEIKMFERSPIIQVLLADGMRRASLDAIVAPIIARMQLSKQDARDILTQQEKADVIYLDPMFPTRTKSALVKKDMRIFHDIVGDDEDAAQLLPIALACAKKRVVVKRPRTAEFLNGLKPSFSMEGSSSRFDIYLL
jgi:16S rRNA (guanine1516-N2)-methyltransferase